MPDYEKLYHIMFNAATDAIELLKEGDGRAARYVLINAQLKAEDEYIEDTDGE